MAIYSEDGLTIVRRVEEANLPSWLFDLEKNFEGYLALCIMLIYGSIIVINVFLRYVFGSQFPGSVTIVMGAVVWLAWVTSSWAVRKDAHLRFSLIRQDISRRKSYLLYMAEWVVWLLVIGGIFRYSIPQLSQYIEANARVVGLALVPRWLLYLGVTVGMGLHLIRILQQMVLTTDKYLRGESVTPTTKLGE